MALQSKQSALKVLESLKGRTIVDFEEYSKDTSYPSSPEALTSIILILDDGEKIYIGPYSTDFLEIC